MCLPWLLALKPNLLLYSLINCANITWVLLFTSEHSFTYVWISSIWSLKTIKIIIFWCWALSRRVMVCMASHFNLRFVMISELIRILLSILARSETICMERPHLRYPNNWCKLTMLFTGSHCLNISMGHISIILWKWSIFS